MVARGEFREDLYYRINVIRLFIPPLRDRPEDLPMLIEHFMRKHYRGKGKLPRLAPETLEAFQRYPWPGNIREMENEIERLLVLGAEHEELAASLISPRIRDAVVDAAPRPTRIYRRWSSAATSGRTCTTGST